MSLPDSPLLIFYHLNNICAFTLHINAFIWEKSFFISFCFVVVRRFFINVLTCMGTFFHWDSTTTKLGWVFSYLIANIKYLIVVWLYNIYNLTSIFIIWIYISIPFHNVETKIDPCFSDWLGYKFIVDYVYIFLSLINLKTKYLQKWKTMDLFVWSDTFIAIIK